jgi:hypothetical protein
MPRTTKECASSITNIIFDFDGPCAIYAVLPRTGGSYIRVITKQNLLDYIEEDSYYYTEVFVVQLENNNKKEENQPVSQKSESSSMERGKEVHRKLLESNTIWDLDMHESMFLDKFTQVQRVPGGWLYHTLHLNSTTFQRDINGSATFVPYEAQKFDTGCVLCGNSVDKTAKTIVQVLDYLNDMESQLMIDTPLVLLSTIKNFLKCKK